MISRDYAKIARRSRISDAKHIGVDPEAYAASSGERKKIETLIGEVEHIHGLTRPRLRGLNGARDEFLLAASCWLLLLGQLTPVGAVVNSSPLRTPKRLPRSDFSA